MTQAQREQHQRSTPAQGTCRSCPHHVPPLSLSWSEKMRQPSENSQVRRSWGPKKNESRVNLNGLQLKGTAPQMGGSTAKGINVLSFETLEIDNSWLVLLTKHSPRLPASSRPDGCVVGAALCGKGVERPPWPPAARCQDHPLPWKPKPSPDIAYRHVGAESPTVEPQCPSSLPRRP